MGIFNENIPNKLRFRGYFLLGEMPIQMAAFNKVLDDIEKHIEKYPIFQQYADRFNESTGLRSGYFVLGILLAPVAIYSMPVLLSGFTIAYPLLMSVKAIERGKSDRTRWLMYWLLFHIISLLEPLCNWLLASISGFTLIRFAYLLWCMAPIERNGCYLSYKFLQPVVLKHIGVADGYLSNVSGRVDDAIHKSSDKLKDKLKDLATDEIVNHSKD